MKKFTLNSLIVLILTCSLAVAETQANRASVEKLVEISMSDSLMDSIYGQVGQMFKSTISEKQKLTGDEMLVVDKYSMKLENFMKEELGADTLVAPLIDIMIKHYNQEEVDAITAFYQTDAGKSMLDKQPMIMGEVMPLVMNVMQEKMPGIQAISMEMLEELNALETNAVQ
jgi:Uncharacterized protein conserved in bacteria